MTTPPHRPRNWFLLRLRTAHAWVGVSALTLFVLVALTGVYLNHTGLFRLEDAPVEQGVLLTTATPASAVPISPAQALEVARGEWGDVPLQFVQLRQEGDRLVYKVRRRGRSDEVTVDASSGRLLAVRGTLQETRFTDDGSARDTRIPWSRVFYDLHTGRLLGEGGKLIIDAGALALLLLGTSGVYLFVVPRWRKWRAGRRLLLVERAEDQESGERMPAGSSGR
jgi:hypothetical protein